jgi:sugar lactone lactonase YvrE
VGHFGNVNGTGTNASFGGPVGLSADVAGNLYVADSLNNTIRKVSPAGLVRTLAGASASQGSVDGHGSAARFNQPGGTAIDTAGNIYVSDFGNSTIRAITPLGEVSTLAGVVGSAGNNDGVGTDARFWGPAGLAADSLGNVYVADYYNSTIRSISPAGEVRTLAGLAGSAGTSDGAGASARFYGPVGIAAAGTDTLFIADSGNHTIRKASLIGSAWIITTIAGLGGQPGALNGTNGDSRFNAPFGITVAPDGNLYVADTLNYTIRKISPAGSNWVVATIAGLAGTFGGSDGTNGQATFYNPIALAADSAGNLFVADNFNQTIRKLAPLGADWLVTTVAGAERTAGSADGAGFAARFYFPSGIAVDTDGSFYVADEHNNTIRKGVLTGYTPANAGAFTPPPLSGRLEVTLLPSEANGQWRFAWESGWRASSAPATNLAAGNYPIEYRNLPGYLTISTNLLVAVAGGQTTFVTNQYYPTLNLTGTTNTGALTVNIGPSLLTNSGWRFLGGTSWRAAGSTATDLLPDLYFIEFQPVSGYAKPANQAVQVPAGLTRVISANYLLAGAPPAGVLLPVPVPDSSIADVETWPFDFNGQLQTDAGLGSGVAVETNVVLTAAHLIFNDQTLSYVSRAWWYLRQEVPAFTPEPMPARGWYVLSGYAAQRTNDLFGGLAPDQSSPQSRNLDVAALYFLSPVAGGGFGGYLPSDSTPNSWLTSTANKMLVGYPVDGSLFGDATITNGVMYQTKPQPFPLSLSSEPVSGQQVYTAPWFLSYPGNSGGPLYVQFNGHYYPAGVYVGTLFSGIVPYASAVRAIDGAVAGVIRTAAALGDSGTNNGGGVIAFIPSQTINAGNPGFIQFHLGPPSALHAGAAWRLVGDATWSTAPDWTRTVTSTNAVSVEFKPLAGWTSPSDQSVSVLPGQITYYTALYAVQPPTLVVDALRRIGITGTTGTVYRLEKRSSLASGAWLPLSTNTISSSGFNLVLPAPLTNGPRSFFRALWLP